jgi:hypothetical protein
MFELLALGVLLAGGLFVIGLVGAVLKLVFLVILLPLRLLGFFLKLVLGLALLPIVAVFGLVALAFVVIGGLLAVIVPLLPLILGGLLVVSLVKWLAKPRPVAMPPA